MVHQNSSKAFFRDNNCVADELGGLTVTANGHSSAKRFRSPKAITGLILNTKKMFLDDYCSCSCY